MRFEVLGVPVDAVTMSDAVAFVRETIRSRTKGYVVFCTVSTVLAARSDPGLLEAIDQASLVTPDGMPLVWLGRRKREEPIDRVYGPDLMRALMSGDDGTTRHFFYGGTEDVLDKMVQRLPGQYRLTIAGSYSPPFGAIDPDAMRRDAALINRAAPDIVWVGLGHPKQERWMHQSRDLLDAPILAGVGAAFDFLAGEKREAPGWMQRVGLQWLHRLLSEPRRLWKRYLVGNSLFVLLLMKERASRLMRRNPE